MSRTAKVLQGVDADPKQPLPRRVPRPFPTRTVRDLIGIARLLYRTWRAANPRPERVAIGKGLGAASTMAAASKPGTRRNRQAREMAEIATHRLGSILDAYVSVKPLIVSAFNAVDVSAEPNERDAKRAARQRR